MIERCRTSNEISLSVKQDSLALMSDSTLLFLQLIVETLNEYLPENRPQLTSSKPAVSSCKTNEVIEDNKHSRILHALEGVTWPCKTQDSPEKIKRLGLSVQILNMASKRFWGLESLLIAMSTWNRVCTKPWHYKLVIWAYLLVIHKLLELPKRIFPCKPLLSKAAYQTTYELANPVLLIEVTRGLQTKTGFKPGEIFRKYLWYLLRERKFDQDAVNDVVYLKSLLNLNDDQVWAIPHQPARHYCKLLNSFALSVREFYWDIS